MRGPTAERRAYHSWISPISPDGFPHQVEIEKLKLDHEREIAELRLEHKKHLERQLTVLTGSAEQVKAMQTEQQKEERIERIRQRVRACVRACMRACVRACCRLRTSDDD